jgi:hypothetical protein
MGAMRIKMRAKPSKTGAKSINFEPFYALYGGFQPDLSRFFVHMEADFLAVSHSTPSFAGLETDSFLLFVGLWDYTVFTVR